MRSDRAWRRAGASQQHARDHRRGGGERQHGRVDADLIEPWEGEAGSQIESRQGRRERLQEPNAAKRQARAPHTAQECQHHALGQGLTDQPAAPCTERDADRDLTLPRGCPREQEIGNVHAGDEQHESHRDRQHEQRGFHRGHQLVLFADQLVPDPWCMSSYLAYDGPDFGGGGLHRNDICKASQHRTTNSAASAGDRHLKRHPELRLAIDDAEDGGVGADAKGDRQDGDSREAGVSGERAHGVLHITPRIVQPAERPRLSVMFLHLFNPS